MSTLAEIRKWLKNPRINKVNQRRRKPLHPKEREWFAKEQMEDKWLKNYNEKNFVIPEDKHPDIRA